MSIHNTTSTQIDIAKTILKQEFESHKPVMASLRDFTSRIDAILIDLFIQSGCPDRFTLIALGSFGRQSLLPRSDLDILLLYTPPLKSSDKENISTFIQSLWDLQFEVGHSVRTVKQCLRLAKADITALSALTDHRYLFGDVTPYNELASKLSSEELCSHLDFITKKRDEQQGRYKKYGENAYNLQPDIKNSPGGLRDIQLLRLIGKRCLGAQNLEQLRSSNHLSEEEYQMLQDSEAYLMNINLAMQLYCLNAKNRLLFDYQITIAPLLGFQDASNSLAIEQLMKAYYRAVKSINLLYDILLPSFEHALVTEIDSNKQIINERFYACNKMLQASHNTVFSETPSALLEIFVLLAMHPEIKGIGFETIRSLRKHQSLIDENYRKNPDYTKLFLSLLRQSINVSEQLARMNLYGILGRYIPAFADVTGQMQYDLFHIYTVDEHTIYIVRNLRRFTLPTFHGQFPLCYEIMQTITKPENLYIAALFHDLGKGRGGDHSTEGARDAEQFCLNHGLSMDDIELITWLITHHLLMSMTAERKDIYDPNSLHKFIQQIPSKRHLDHLYLLTVADICATNPRLWNSWKDTLLRELYSASKQLLASEQTPQRDEQLIQDKKNEALARLAEQVVNVESLQQYWSHLPDLYFIREATASIVQHALELIDIQSDGAIKTIIKPHHRQGGTEIIIYTPYHANLFAKNCTVLSNLLLNIVEARIYNCDNQYSLHCYVVLDKDNQTIRDPAQIAQLHDYFQQQYPLLHSLPRLKQRRINYEHHHTINRLSVQIEDDPLRQRSELTLICADRHGLLAQVSRIFLECKILMHTAKISTMGERVEDVFFITDLNLRTLSLPTKQLLLNEIHAKLSLLDKK